MFKGLIALLLSLTLYASHPKIHVIGDSHTEEFKGLQYCHLHHLGPITMHRVGRDGLTILNFRTLKVKEGDLVVLVFGEIDARCHIGKQRDLKGRPLDEIIDTLVRNYLLTIQYNQATYKKVSAIVYTITPPTEQIYSSDFPFYGSLLDRVEITQKLNSKLHELAPHFNIVVLDVYEDYADANGVLIPELSDGTVHLKILNPIQKKLEQLVNEELYKRRYNHAPKTPLNS
jgi:hypothetical protein